MGKRDCKKSIECTIAEVTDSSVYGVDRIVENVPFGKSKTTQLLKDMGEKGVVAVEGKGRGTKYIIK